MVSPAILPSPQEFDPSLEESFAKKVGPGRDGWQLIREGEILHDHQKTFVPISPSVTKTVRRYFWKSSAFGHRNIWPADARHSADFGITKFRSPYQKSRCEKVQVSVKMCWFTGPP
jgi:hypothetical protein